MYNAFLGCIMYADDLLLFSASVLDLQKMLDSCGSVGDKLGIKFNCKKSACMIIGPNKLSPISPLIINGSQVQWVDKIKYLGIILSSAKRFTVEKEIRKLVANFLFLLILFLTNANLLLILLNLNCLRVSAYQFCYIALKA